MEDRALDVKEDIRSVKPISLRTDQDTSTTANGKFIRFLVRKAILFK